MLSSSKLGRYGLATIAAVGCLALAACGSSNDSSSGSGGGSATASSGSSDGGSIKGKKVIYVACSDQNQWCRAYNHRIVDAMKAKGVDITYLQDPYDPVLQVQHLNQAISQKPDAIFLLASDARAVVPALRKAKAAGIPVVNLVGPTVPESDPYYAARIINNHKELGENAAKLLVQGLQKEGVKSGNVIAITGASVQPEVAVRMGGFKDVLAQNPQYKLVEVQDGAWDQVKTAKIAQQLFAKYRDKGGIVGAYGMADQQAAGIIQSAQQAGLKVGEDKKGLIVVGSNCFKIGMTNIGKGLQYGTSTQAAGNTADFTVPLLEKFLAGDKLPATSLTTEYPVDQDNLSKWKAACSVA
jgi:ABC-type sugar transport system substrate-binding protein